MRHADAIIRTAGRGFGSSSALCYPSVAGDQKWADTLPPLPSDQSPSVRAVASARDVPRWCLYACRFPPPLPRGLYLPVAIVIRLRFPPREIAASRQAFYIIDIINVCLQWGGGLLDFRFPHIVTDWYIYIYIIHYI